MWHMVEGGEACVCIGWCTGVAYQAAQVLHTVIGGEVLCINDGSLLVLVVVVLLISPFTPYWADLAVYVSSYLDEVLVTDRRLARSQLGHPLIQRTGFICLHSDCTEGGEAHGVLHTTTTRRVGGG